jgi:hypothetical protein
LPDLKQHNGSVSYGFSDASKSDHLQRFPRQLILISGTRPTMDVPCLVIAVSLFAFLVTNIGFTDANTGAIAHRSIGPSQPVVMDCPTTL